MNNSSELIQVVRQEAVAVVTLNRPDKRNAMSDAMRQAFVHTFEKLADDPEVRAVVLTGAGAAFCAGGDVAGMRERMSAAPGEVGFNGWRRQQGVHHAQMLLHTLPMPVVAAVNGSASGLGADLALACDFVVASQEASFAWSYIHRGIIADGGGLYFLPRRVGLGRAKELIFSGRSVSAEEALRLGIADQLAAPADVLGTALALASRMSQGSRKALALDKTILNQSLESTAEQVFAQGSQAQAICYTSTEHRQAVESFLAQADTRRATKG